MMQCREAQTFRVPLVGCDGFLLALEDLMESGGQGRHFGLTVLKLGAGFSFTQLRSATERFSQSHPLLHARIRRNWWFGIPAWHAEGPFSKDAVRIVEHSSQTSLEQLCEAALQAPARETMRFDVVYAEHCTLVVFKWLHLLFDGRGVELALHEISRLASAPEEPARLQMSWGAAFETPAKIGEQYHRVQPFIDRYNELKTTVFESLGGAVPSPGKPRCDTVHFNQEQTRTIRARAERLTGGIFQLPYYFAIVARAHADVFRHRHQPHMNFYAAAPIQGRRRGAKHPIFQNQPSQFYFALRHHEAHSLEAATNAVHSQFSTLSRNKVDTSFFIMLQWLRRIPKSLYIDNIQHQTRGHLTSFFHSHTGQFMPETPAFCGAQIDDGWHIPTVSQPPGTGVFFSERNQRLTATISYRDGVLSVEELNRMRSHLIQDLLGRCL